MTKKKMVWHEGDGKYAARVHGAVLAHGDSVLLRCHEPNEDWTFYRNEEEVIEYGA